MKSSSSTKDSTPASGNRRGSGMTTSANSGNPCYIVMCPARPKAVSRAKPSLFGPGQARPLVTAQQRLWPGSEELKAKAAGPGRGFSRTKLNIEICVNYCFSNLCKPILFCNLKYII